MNIEEAINRLKQRIKDNEDYANNQVWLTQDVYAVQVVLNELDYLKNKCKEYDTKICPSRYIQGQIYMENKILTLIKEDKNITIEELLKKLEKEYIK